MTKSPPKAKLRVLDTFAGAGGFSLGFEMAGCEVVGAVEMDSWATDTFKHNHPDAVVMRADISKVSDDEFSSTFGGVRPDIVIGGPPCQGFSIANRNAGDPKDPRNSLFKDFVRVGRIFSPTFMVMENVPNLLAARTNDGKRVIDIISESLSELGYHVYSKVLQATDFGVPQIRSRLFVIASSIPLAQPFPEPTHALRASAAEGGDLFSSDLPSCPTLWDAISDLPELLAGEGGEESKYTLPPQTEYQRMLRQDSETLFNHKAMNHTPRMVERFSHMEWGQSGNDVPDHLKPRKRNSTEIATSAFDQNNRRMYPHRPCHTVPASFYANFVHPYQHRNFTAREGARIQSFPDNFRFLGKPTVVSHKLLAREGREEEKFLCQYNQIGNAVPPLLARAVAKNLLSHLKEYEEAVNARSRKQSRAERESLNEVS
ncbi:DNA cytosine methyltransferase [Burkholderia multivorans]|uniref:DNA cytosine methyltransferase n=1 Tax=Burkholderia multivorans TaxID=87883 RepID=UPI002019B6A0|nr:DNA cytosine methyltransferase [Burkholderia multivorans]MCL4630003.1 DNA cytosine methyltransferase [Burkholderia multivorans]MCO1389225.1 DNA cytosine methyltransferase [Burkholderia multivorans]UQO10881.1 DNA cytosine methyltransferase [Burkholderia multivorans]UQO57237.1 DNA cytosine methyltransferase [Burkholderia multivorans]UQO60862.1 DNA cytosine methyltransferase [Burkholderia multivorans]